MTAIQATRNHLARESNRMLKLAQDRRAKGDVAAARHYQNMAWYLALAFDALEKIR